MRLYNIITKIRTLLLLVLAGIFISPISSVSAAEGDFTIDVNTTYEYEPERETVTVLNQYVSSAHTSAYYIPAGGEQEYVLPFFTSFNEEFRDSKADTIKVTDDNGVKISFRTEIEDDKIILYVEDTQDLTYRRDKVINISYEAKELVNINGNVVNIFIPGLPEDTDFESISNSTGLKTAYSYNTQLKVPGDNPNPSYISPPDVIRETRSGRDRIYTVGQDDLIGETVWFQFGTSQYYYFKIEQDAAKTDMIIPERVNEYTDLLSTNIYRLPLPREDSENQQEVFIKQISPEPSEITTDSEDNLIALFEVPANIDTTITVEGYIKLSVNQERDQVPSIDITEYLENAPLSPGISKYTLADTYWESDTQYIQDLAVENAIAEGSILDQVEINYNFVIDTFDYSYSKLDLGNPRLGALQALESGQAVCMEYSDTFIALSRAQGIPTRAVVGYGNDPTGVENAISNDEAQVQNIAHQWSQVWIPEYGWLSVDPTWGESGRRYIGSNLDHILWYTIGDSAQGYLGTSLSSADPVGKGVLTSYDVSIQALNEKEFSEISANLQTIDSLTEILSDKQLDGLSYMIKTTPVGKAAIIVGPILLIFFVVFTGSVIFSVVFRRRRERR